MFIGYNTKYKVYRCLDVATSQIYTTRHAKFDEATFPFTGVVKSIDLATLLVSSFEEAPIVAPVSSINVLSPVAVPSPPLPSSPFVICPND